MNFPGSTRVPPSRNWISIEPVPRTLDKTATMHSTADAAVFAEPPNPERGAWSDVRSGWRQLYGSFDRLGVSVEMHDFRAAQSLDWARSFHRDSVEICLNLDGRGEVTRGEERMTLVAESAGFYTAGRGLIAAERRAGERHRFITLELSREFVARQISGAEDGVDPALLRDLLGAQVRSGVAEGRRFGAMERTLAAGFCDAPVAPAALPLWHQSRVLDAVAQFFFPPARELFCTRQKRLMRERVERVRAILEARLAEPPTLEELGREVGVSQFYLSRIFSEETGATIPQFLRRIRMQRAAELLRGGRHNVTEAAFAVGYSSLGHFSKSFCEVIGCCPAIYPHARNLVKQAAARPHHFASTGQKNASRGKRLAVARGTLPPP